MQAAPGRASLRPLAITGHALCNALGRDRNEVTVQLFAGRSGLAGHWPGIESPVGTMGSPPNLPATWARHDSRSARLLWLALEPLLPTIAQARERWGASRIALVLGTSTGGLQRSEDAWRHRAEYGALPSDYSFSEQHALSGLLVFAAEALGMTGPSYAVPTACSSSAKALAAAQRLICAGWADAAVVAGVDALCGITVHGFHALGIASPRRCEPFGADRRGTNLGEGAACVLLEAEATASHWLLACGESSDAHHLSAPHPTGLGAELAMRQALERAGSPTIDYINAHGTGTPHNDRTEALALARVFPQVPAVSSSKSAFGHLLGAAGLSEVVVCLLAREQGRAPPHLLLGPEDATLGLPMQQTVTSLRTALSNSFAFGGSNCSVIVGDRPTIIQPPRREPLEGIAITQHAVWPPAALDPSLANESVPNARLLPERLRGRASLLSRMFAEVLEPLLAACDTPGNQPTIVFGSAHGEVQTLCALLDLLLTGSSSPARFQSSVHNTASGLVSISTGDHGFSTTIAAGSQTLAMALLEGVAYLQAHGGSVLVAVADEPLPRELGEATYPALAGAFSLRLVERSASMLVRDLAFDASRPAIHDDSPWQSNPCSPLLSLARALSAKEPARVSLGGDSSGSWLLDLGAAKRGVA